MSLRDEILKLVDAERAELTRQRKAGDERNRKKEALFAPVKKLMAEIASAAPEYCEVDYFSTSASLAVGLGVKTGGRAELKWTVEIEFKQEAPDYIDGAPFFELEEERFYDYSGFQDSETRTSNKSFDTEAELAEYMARKFASTIARAMEVEEIRERVARERAKRELEKSNGGQT
jgi:hypothetical protein